MCRFQELLAAKKPRNRGLPVRPGAPCIGNNGKKNGKWAMPDGDIPDSRQEQDSERKIPGALPV
jgi:hypothetical protein